MSSYKIIDTGIKEPDVCIAMLAYNHEKFLKKAIDSVLMQKTTFSYKIIIAEDCSTDSTREIILDYQSKYPDKFKVILQNKNVGAKKNNFDLLLNLEGKYIAALEGDDYWTDPLKLQTQLNFMESNDMFSICFTDYSIYNQNSNSYDYPGLIEKYKNKNTFSRYEIILNNFIPTLTVIFRNSPEILLHLNKELFPPDWFIHILNSKFGKIKFLPINSAVYRKHEGGVCSSSDPILNNSKYLKSIEVFRKQFMTDYILQLLFVVTKTKIRLQSLKFRLKLILKPE